MPEEITQRYLKVTWSDMIGMKNILINDYIEVDLEAVWLTVKDDLPEAEREIGRIIEELGND
ncbi:MAG: HepT-like ribonuclease domain-containing protein [Actinomycetota bacterium]|nr:HepT-like ribonuclease domain-containing protein [Actinomycetota bacterium]